MAFNRAILAELERLGLNPNKAHTAKALRDAEARLSAGHGTDVEEAPKKPEPVVVDVNDEVKDAVTEPVKKEDDKQTELVFDEKVAEKVKAVEETPVVEEPKEEHNQSNGNKKNKKKS